MWEAFLTACQALSLALGRTLGVQLLKWKVWMMQDIRSGKKKKYWKIRTGFNCYTVLYWDLVTGSISLPQPDLPWGLSLSLFHMATFDCFSYLLLWPSLLPWPQITFLCIAPFQPRGPASVFKGSEKQLLLLLALRHCQAAASFTAHLLCSHSGRISGS